MSRQLKFHERMVYSALNKVFPDQVDDRTPDQFRSPCPAHDSDGMNMVTYLKKDGIIFKCFSAACSHEEIRLALKLKESQLKPNAGNGCTLEQYSKAKQIPLEELLGFGLRDTKYGGMTAVQMPYWGLDDTKLTTRFRVSLEAPVKVKSLKRASVALYGLWRTEDYDDMGNCFIVEGESDCHTLWFRQQIAYGIPGAQQINLVMPDLIKLADQYPKWKFFAIIEPDQGGAAILKALAKSPLRDRVKCVRLDPFKDPSDLHCDDPDLFWDRWKPAVKAAVSIEDATKVHGVTELSDLAARVRHILGNGGGREAKEEVSAMVGDFLLKQGHLLSAEFDEAREGVPYIIVDGTPQALDGGNDSVRFLLQEVGLNPVEPAYSWLLKVLQKRAVSEGKRVRVHRYSFKSDDKLYISCGRSNLVLAQLVNDHEVELTKHANGFEGVLFSGNSCFPEWEPDEELRASEVRLFRPQVEAPPESLNYGRLTQFSLIETWLTCVLAGVQAPILVALGSYGSGKSLCLEGAIRLFMGDSQNLGQIPADVRSFCSIAAAVPIYVIDNLDSRPPDWLPDALAQAVTGGDFIGRQNYTDSEVFRKRLRARIGVTSRTADFAKRKDIQDRVLPLFFSEMSPERRRSRDELLGEIDEKRDEILSHLSMAAVLALRSNRQVPLLKTRFQSFGRILLQLTNAKVTARALDALEAAQQLAIRDPDTLTRALLEYPHDLRGTATQIMEKLRNAGHRLTVPQGGKSAAARLRECRSALRHNGHEMLVKQVGSNTIFEIIRGDREGNEGKVSNFG